MRWLPPPCRQVNPARIEDEAQIVEGEVRIRTPFEDFGDGFFDAAHGTGSLARKRVPEGRFPAAGSPGLARRKNKRIGDSFTYQKSVSNPAVRKWASLVKARFSPSRRMVTKESSSTKPGAPGCPMA